MLCHLSSGNYYYYGMRAHVYHALYSRGPPTENEHRRHPLELTPFLRWSEERRRTQQKFKIVSEEGRNEVHTLHHDRHDKQRTIPFNIICDGRSL